MSCEMYSSTCARAASAARVSVSRAEREGREKGEAGREKRKKKEKKEKKKETKMKMQEQDALGPNRCWTETETAELLTCHDLQAVDNLW